MVFIYYLVGALLMFFYVCFVPDKYNPWYETNDAIINITVGVFWPLIVCLLLFVLLIIIGKWVTVLGHKKINKSF